MMTSGHFIDLLVSSLYAVVDADGPDEEEYRRLKGLAGVIGEDWKSTLLALPDHAPETLEERVLTGKDAKERLMIGAYAWLKLARPETWERETRLFACDCAERVLHIFEEAQPGDDRPRKAIEAARRYAEGVETMAETRKALNAASTAVDDAFATHGDGAVVLAALASCRASGASTYHVRATIRVASQAADSIADERAAQWAMLVDRLCREE